MKVATFWWWAKGSRGAASEGPTILHICLCNFQLAAWSTSLEVTTVFHWWSHGRFVEMQINHRRKKLHRTNQGSNFLKDSFSNKIMYEPQYNLEEKVNPSILKDEFSSVTDPLFFMSTEPVLLDWLNETSWVFPALKSTSHFLPQSTVSLRSD